MGMNALRRSAMGGLMKFFLFGLLVLAVGGLVLMDVGGFFRGGISGANVATVGGKDISASEFDRIARRAVARYGMTTQEAYRMGLMDQILGAEIRGHVLQEIAGKTGLSVSQDRVMEQIRQMIEPIAAQQQMPPADALSQILFNQGMSERDFIASIQREIESATLTSALQSGFATLPEFVVRDIYNTQAETRNITYIPYLDSDIKQVKEPEDTQLETLYQSLRDSNYAKPELRAFQVLQIDTESLRDTIDISEQELRNFYDTHIDAYTTPDSHTLEQALFVKEEDAKASLQEFNAGKSLEDAVQTATGSKTAYLGEKDVTPEMLTDEMRAEVVKTETPGTLIGPVKTPLGWSIAVVKKINPKRVQEFTEVEKEIRAQLEETQLVDQIYELANLVDDQFAGGATVDEVSQQVRLKITGLPPITQAGLTADEKDAFESMENFREAVLQNGFDLMEGETSPVVETPDGTLIAVHLQSITPRSHTPFEDVKSEIRERWVKDQKRLDNLIAARETLTKIEKSGQTLKQLASEQAKTPRTLSDISRDGDLKKPLTARAVQNLFEAAIGKPLLVDIEGGVAIAVVDSYEWPSEASDEDLQAVRDSQIQNMRNESLMTFLQSKQDDYNVMINRALLERLYAQSPEEAGY